METVSASLCWGGPRTDVLTVFVEPTPDDWVADPSDGSGEIGVLYEVDAQGRRTDRVAGVEIVGFLDFDGWGDLPKLDLLWHMPGQESLSLEGLLKRAQQELRQRSAAVA